MLKSIKSAAHRHAKTLVDLSACEPVQRLDSANHLPREGRWRTEKGIAITVLALYFMVAAYPHFLIGLATMFATYGLVTL